MKERPCHKSVMGSAASRTRREAPNGGEAAYGLTEPLSSAFRRGEGPRGPRRHERP